MFPNSLSSAVQLFHMQATDIQLRIDIDLEIRDPRVRGPVGIQIATRAMNHLFYEWIKVSSFLVYVAEVSTSFVYLAKVLVENELSAAPGRPASLETLNERSW